MNIKKRALYLYLPSICLCLFLILRLDNNILYHGLPVSSLPDGHYSIQSISCLEGKVKFDYSKPLNDDWNKTKNDVRELLYYDGEVERKVVVKGSQLTRIIGQKGCYIYSQEKIIHNKNGIFTVGGSKRVESIPYGCSLKYKNMGVIYQDEDIHRSSEIALNTEDSVKHLIHYSEGYYLLYEMNAGDFRSYGCKLNDKLITTLIKDI